MKQPSRLLSGIAGLAALVGGCQGVKLSEPTRQKYLDAIAPFYISRDTFAKIKEGFIDNKTGLFDSDELLHVCMKADNGDKNVTYNEISNYLGSQGLHY